MKNYKFINILLFIIIFSSISFTVPIYAQRTTITHEQTENERLFKLLKEQEQLIKTLQENINGSEELIEKKRQDSTDMQKKIADARNKLNGLRRSKELKKAIDAARTMVKNLAEEQKSLDEKITETRAAVDKLESERKKREAEVEKSKAKRL